jgi:hypothetical protein
MPNTQRLTRFTVFDGFYDPIRQFLLLSIPCECFEGFLNWNRIAPFMESVFSAEALEG